MENRETVSKLSSLSLSAVNMNIMLWIGLTFLGLVQAGLNTKMFQMLMPDVRPFRVSIARSRASEDNKKC